MNLRLSGDQTRALRLRAQRLSLQRVDPEAGVIQVLKAVCGVQAQDAQAAALAVRVRSSGLLARDVEQARLRDRSVIRTWCQRGTLHLLAVEDYAWLLPLLGPLFAAGSPNRELELGWDEDTFEKGIRLLKRALADQGPLTREEISGLLDSHGLPAEGQAPIHLIQRAALQGLLCQGPDHDGKPAFVLVKDWLGKEYALEAWVKKEPPLVKEAALARLARRYVEAYGPAGPQDLAAWSGIPMRDARLAWELIAGDLIPVEIPGGPAYLLEERLTWLEEPLAQPDVRLLPKFDTYLLGYTARDLVVPPQYARRIHPGGGILHAALLVDGRARGTWSLKRRRDRLEVRVESFEDLPPDVEPGLAAETADLERFLEVGVKHASDR